MTLHDDSLTCRVYRLARFMVRALLIQSVLLVGLHLSAPGAEVKNLSLAQTAKGIVLIYDLDADRPVRVRLVGSDDDGKTWGLALRSVSGDVGERIEPGVGKKIVWVVQRDYPRGIDDLDVVLDVIAETPEHASVQGSRPTGPVYFVIPFRGEVGREIQATVIEAGLAEALRWEPDVVVFEVDSPGGLISELYRLLDLVGAWQQHPRIPVVAVIPRQAMSAAAIFSMACARIYMMPGSTIGAAMAIRFEGGKVNAVGEKFSSAYRGKARASVERVGHEPLLAEAMIDPDLRLFLAEGEGGASAVVRGGSGSTDGTRMIIDRGKLLTLSAEEAVEVGLAAAVLEGYPAIGADMGLDGWAEFGTGGRLLVEKHEAEVQRVLQDYDDLVYTIRETIDKLRASSGRQLAAREANIWEVRNSVDEIEQMARDYPFIASRVRRTFENGTGTLRGQCDVALRKIKAFRIQRSRAGRRR